MSDFAKKKYAISILINRDENNNMIKRFILKKNKHIEVPFDSTSTIHKLKTKSKF